MKSSDVSSGAYVKRIVATIFGVLLGLLGFFFALYSLGLLAAVLGTFDTSRWEAAGGLLISVSLSAVFFIFSNRLLRRKD
jgi:protein-S-isoprenylcysteine O-methyltransferase Ste14